MPINSIHMFLLLYFILRSVVAYMYPTVIVAMRCVTVSIYHYLSIYLSIYQATKRGIKRFMGDIRSLPAASVVLHERFIIIIIIIIIIKRK